MTIHLPMIWRGSACGRPRGTALSRGSMLGWLGWGVDSDASGSQLPMSRCWLPQIAGAEREQDQANDLLAREREPGSSALETRGLERRY